MKTTIKMVAEYAGVSRGTVDRVLHDRGNVNKDVLKKVQMALKELDYRPNAIGRALAMQKKNIRLGIIIPENPGFFRDEIQRAAAMAEEEYKDLGVEIQVAWCNALKPEQYVKAIDAMLSRGFCGFAVCAQNSQMLIDKINQLKEQEVPVITVNSDIPDSERTCFIGEDAIRCGRAAAEIICKYRKPGEEILVLGGIPEFTGHQDRLRGFETYMKEQGISKSEYRVVYTYEKYEFAYEQLEIVFSKEPQIGCIYLAVESTAAYRDVLAMCKEKARPFVVCHDTADHTLKALKDGLVDFTIDQDVYAQGYRPLQMLVDHFLYGKGIEVPGDKIVLHIITSECVG